MIKLIKHVLYKFYCTQLGYEVFSNMVTALLESLSELWKPSALMVYAGAIAAFYGSRAIWVFLVKPAVEKFLAPGEGMEAKGLRNPGNWKELTDVAVGMALLAIPAGGASFKTGVVAGMGLSLTDHLLNRFPSVGGLIPR